MPQPTDTGSNVDIARALQSSNVPLRRPSWTDPTFWSLPIVLTVAQPVEAGAGWVNFLTVAGLSGYTAKVTGYVATAQGDASLSNLEFRFVHNGRLVSSVDFVSTVERNRESATLFPTFPQETFFALNTQSDVLAIQVRNNGVFQENALCAFYGFYYDNRNQAERSVLEGLTDA